ncbi:MAG: LLM class flavin-dependent oxidoreductase [Ilumatobacter sp.]|nr:LLM class flavin-dependent oxidoreductase [Ilumatobacter sp.]
MTLRIGITPPGADRAALEFVRDAERLGIDSVWVPEAWMYDALTPLGYLAAITDRIRLATGVVQLGARSPAMLAMSALALQKMSDGRFVLGIGTSGPQVMEGWHGVRFDRPVTRTRETIEIIRRITAGDRLTYDGDAYTLPLPDGEGRPLRSPVGGVDIPIYVASMGPANLRLTGASADGWIGTAFMPETADVFLDPIREGAEAAGRTLDDIDLTVAAGLEFADDADAAARRHAAGYAFTIGAMGSPATNFYNRAFARQGFADAIEEVHALWQSGDRDAAGARVPIEIGLRTNLIGDDTTITDRLRRYRDVGVDTLRVGIDAASNSDRLDQLGRLVDLVDAVNTETTDPG